MAFASPPAPDDTEDPTARRPEEQIRLFHTPQTYSDPISLLAEIPRAMRCAITSPWWRDG